MFDGLKERWRVLKRSAPGQRFEERYQRNRSRRRNQSNAVSFARMAAGAGIIVVGFIMLLTPGPGILVMIVGAAMIGTESRAAARLLDRAELLLRRAAKTLKPR